MAFARVATPLPSRPLVLAAPLASRRLVLAAPLPSRRLVLAAALPSRPLVLAAPLPTARAHHGAPPSAPAHRLGVEAGHGGGAAGRDVKFGFAKDGADLPSMGDDEDESFEKMYRIRSKQMDDLLGFYMPLPTPLPMSEEEKAVQEKLKEIAEKCIALIHDAMRRLPRAERHRLDKVLWTSHFAFAVVKSRATHGRASMGMAVVIAEKLYDVLKMVSSGCSTPLPLDMKEASKMLIPFTAPVFPSDHSVEVLVFAMIDNLYNAVKRDINVMISDVSSRA